MVTRPPHYLRVANDLEERIRSGEYQPGAKLPSVQQIADHYHLARATAYRAVRELHSRNLVYGQQGQGVFVNDLTDLTDVVDLTDRVDVDDRTDVDDPR